MRLPSCNSWPEAQEVYRRETHFHLRRASVELATRSPGFQKVFDNLDAAICTLQNAISDGALDGEQGAAWMDRVGEYRRAIGYYRQVLHTPGLLKNLTGSVVR